MLNPIFRSVIFAIITFGAALAVSYVFAWTQPSSSPPFGNISTPLNTSSAAQTKAGNLSISGDANGTRLCINGDCKSSWPW